MTAARRLAAIMALHGRLDEARSAVQAGLAFNPTFNHFPVSCRRGKRQSHLSRSARTRLRWHAQGRSPRTMTAARRLAAILAAAAVGY
jgi:hypothetical protein